MRIEKVKAFRSGPTATHGEPNEHTKVATRCYEAALSLWYAVSFAAPDFVKFMVFLQGWEGGPTQWIREDPKRTFIAHVTKTLRDGYPVAPGSPDWKKYEREYKRLSDKVVAMNMPMVNAIAFKFSRKEKAALTREDMIQEGVIGLIRAIRKYDPTTGFAFSTYCFYWIYQGISRASLDSHLIHTPIDQKKVKEELADKSKCARNILSLDNVIRTDGAKSSEAMLHDSITSESFLSPEETVCAHQDRRNLMHWIENLLTPKESAILRMRFDDDMTLKEIGDHYKQTRERIRQIESQALGKLRDYMDPEEANMLDVEQI